jgi:hypothetical protein
MARYYFGEPELVLALNGAKPACVAYVRARRSPAMDAEIAFVEKEMFAAK